MYKNQESRTLYEDAAICKSGHVLSSTLTSQPQTISRFCATCASEIISQCAACDTKIQGSRYFEKTGQILADLNGTYRPYKAHKYPNDTYKLPAYCHNCGHPYPWTETTIKELEEIIDMADELNDDERTILKEKFPLLLVDQPGNSAASLKISQLLKKAKDPTLHALKSALASKLVGKALDMLPKLLGW